MSPRGYATDTSLAPRWSAASCAYGEMRKTHDSSAKPIVTISESIRLVDPVLGYAAGSGAASRRP